MTQKDAITKRDFPGMSYILWIFEQVFGPTERIAMTEGGNRYGVPSIDANYVTPVLEQK